MDALKLTITEEGQVYRLGRHGRQVLLGHISCLAPEETPLGRAVRAWWRARLAPEEQIDTLAVACREDEPYCVPVPETGAVIGSQPYREPVDLDLEPIEAPGA